MNGKYQFQALAFSLTNILQVELDLTNASNSYSIYIYSRGWFYSHLIGMSRVGYYNMRQLQMFQKVEYDGGPIFKVVLEC